MGKMTSQQYPEPTAGALIFNPQGKIFLMKSHKWKNGCVIPGGHIELGEKIEDALKCLPPDEAVSLAIDNPVNLSYPENNGFKKNNISNRRNISYL